MEVLTAVKANLEAATCSSTPVDNQLLSELDLILSLSPELAPEAQQLLPLFTKLASTSELDKIPETLIPKILQNASLHHVFTMISPALFSAGLDEPTTAPILVQMLQKVTTDNAEGIELCKKALLKLLDPEISYVGKIEQLITVLCMQNILLTDIPDQALYESIDPQLQSRLMAINTIFLQYKRRPRFLFWDLTSPDIKDDPLLMDIHIVYIGDLCALGADISSQVPLLCSMYIADEPFVFHDIERVFVQLCNLQPLAFRQIDREFGLLKKRSVSLLAKLPTSYLAEDPMVSQLELNSQTVPAFCNLATDPVTFDMLQLELRKINALPFDLRAELVAAATVNPVTARLFVGRFPTVMDAIIVPAAHPDAAARQRIINANLKRHGIRITEAPEIATAHAQ